MKISIVGTIGKSKKLPTGFAFNGPSSRQMDDPVKLRFAYAYRINDPAQAAALRSHRLWVFRNKVVRVDNGNGANRAEIVTRIKHKVLSGEKAFVKMARAVELSKSLRPDVRRGAPPSRTKCGFWCGGATRGGASRAAAKSGLSLTMPSQWKRVEAAQHGIFSCSVRNAIARRAQRFEEYQGESRCSQNAA